MAVKVALEPLHKLNVVKRPGSDQLVDLNVLHNIMHAASTQPESHAQRLSPDAESHAQQLS